MTVRLATVEDAPDLARMGVQFHGMSPYAGLAHYDEGAVTSFIVDLISNPNGVVLRHDSGTIGGVLVPLYFSPGNVVASELFWWSTSNGRALLKEFEAWAREKGAAFVALSRLAGGDARDCVVERLYRRAGYAQTEAAYLRAL